MLMTTLKYQCRCSKTPNYIHTICSYSCYNCLSEDRSLQTDIWQLVRINKNVTNKAARKLMLTVKVGSEVPLIPHYTVYSVTHVVHPSTLFHLRNCKLQCQCNKLMWAILLLLHATFTCN